MTNREHLRLACLIHYSGGSPQDLPKCVQCGETRLPALSINHINGGDGKHQKEINRDIIYWLVENDFPLGFQTLCMNCKFVKRAEKRTV